MVERRSVITVLAVVVALGACSSSDDPSSSAPSSNDEDPSNSSIETTVTVAGASLSRLEETEAIVGCLQERGLAVQVDPDSFPPGIEFDNRIVSEEQFEPAYEACIEELTEAGLLRPTISGPEQLAQLYEDFLTAAECIEAEGYEVPDPPSLEVFVDTNGAAWNPFDAVPPEKGLEELTRIDAKCGL